MQKFMESRSGKWRRLEELTARASKFRLRGLSGEEVREFGRLYRRTAADLAIAREEVKDKRLVNYINHLVGRAHGVIYRSEASGFRSIFTFFQYELPAVFRQAFRPILLAFLISIASAAFAFVVTSMDESFADQIMPGLKDDIRAHRNWTDELNRANPLGATLIQTNNIRVTFYAFAGGLTLGIGTFLVMVENGLMLGVVIQLCIKYKFWDVLIFMCGHGVIELSAIFIAGGAGFLMARSFLMPGNLRRIDALVTNGMIAVKLAMGCILMLLIAGTIEGFISPAHIPAVYKFSISAISAVALVVYFLKPDLRMGNVAGSSA
ncbi:MAG TPA: stage II sporulation protein M [Blastocatellia bacterium]|nr:stage II sporulation protein M [Blastocatellia bacterium]